MSITDELRAWAKGSTLSSWTAEHLTAIADHIDAEHKKACDDAWDNGYEADYLGIEKWLTEHPQVMEHHGWVRLPLDADGEYIHVGDELHDEWQEQNQGEVERLIIDRHGWWLMLKNDCERFYAHKFHEWHHHHELTVEDLIRDVILCCVGHSPEYWGEPIAECTAKLKLAGDEDA